MIVLSLVVLLITLIFLSAINLILWYECFIPILMLIPIYAYRRKTLNMYVLYLSICMIIRYLISQLLFYKGYITELPITMHTTLFREVTGIVFVIMLMIFPIYTSYLELKKDINKIHMSNDVKSLYKDAQIMKSINYMWASVYISIISFIVTIFVYNIKGVIINLLLPFMIVDMCLVIFIKTYNSNFIDREISLKRFSYAKKYFKQSSS